jgi:predicted nucleotidyltransferase
MRLRDVEAMLGALNDAQVRYLIVGGLAVIAHGYVRLTVDVDIVLNLERDNVLRALNALEGVGYHPLVPVKATAFADEELRESWRKEKQMIVFQMMNLDRPDTRLDIFVTEPFDFDREYLAARWEEVAGIRSPILGIEALIAMKQEAGRPKDLGDVGELKKLLDIEKDESTGH